MSFVSFLFSKSFYKHLAIILLLGIVLFFVAIKALDIYTNNGEYIETPILQGADVDSLMATASNNYLLYEVVDSMYDDYALPGTVLMQNPKPGAKVKPGRKIYLTIVAKMSEMVKMPNLIDLTLRRAIEVVELSHLRIAHIDFVPDMALNAVLDQWYQGQKVPNDTLLPKYAAIELKVGNGFGKQAAVVPFLIGKSAEAAVTQIMKSSLNVGRIDTLASDNFEGDLRVYKQTPMSIPDMQHKTFLGDTVHLLLRSANGFDFQPWIESFISQDSLLKVDSLYFESAFDVDTEEDF